MGFSAGDLVRPKLHRGSARSDFRVLRIKPNGKVQVLTRCGRIMSLLPHQLCLVKAVARS